MGARRGVFGDRQWSITFAVGTVVVLALALASLAAAGPPDSASLVKDINPTGSNSSFAPDGAEPDRVVAGGFVYFVADDGVHGRELWKSDGTNTGTTMVRDIDDNGTDGSDPQNLAVLGGEVFFSADDGDVGRELWKTDGTFEGTVLVKDIFDLGTSGSSPGSLTRVGDHVYFSALDGSQAEDHGIELWKTDGSGTGTVLVKDIKPGSSDNGSPKELANVNGILFFSARDSGTDSELWKSDGTVEGTVRVQNINPGGASNPQAITEFDGKAFFKATNGSDGVELFSSNGTDAGTSMVKDINPNGDSEPTELTQVGASLFFSANDGEIVDGGHRTELWKTDGTGTGTNLVKDIFPGTGESKPEQLTDLGGKLLFSARESNESGNELWRSDGTDAGTVRVLEINSNPNKGSFPSDFVDFGGTLLFAASQGAGSGSVGVKDRQLWSTDGTGAGTTKLTDIFPANTDGFAGPRHPVKLGGDLIFGIDDGNIGLELWKAVDTIAPETTIESGLGEGSTTAETGPTFTYSSDEDPSTFECRLYPAGTSPPAFADCSGPGASHTNDDALTDGAHVFEVRATDLAGNVDPTPAVRNFTVETAVVEPPDPDPDPDPDPTPDYELDASARAKKVQKQKGRKVKIRVAVKAGESINAKLTGKVRIGRKNLKLKPRKTTVPASRSKSVKLVLKKGRDAKKVRRFISKKRRRAKAVVKVRLADQAGNVERVKLKVKLKR